MLDSHLHPRLKPLLNVCAARLERLGVSADGVTLTGFAIGVLALPFLGLRWYRLGLLSPIRRKTLWPGAGCFFLLSEPAAVFSPLPRWRQNIR